MSIEVMTPRQAHARRLRRISLLVGGYNRRFTYQDSKNFLDAYNYYADQGYPQESAALRAYDHYDVDRRVREGRFRSGRW